MYLEDELQPISSLQHLVFCERQAALIYLEGIWDENLYTAEGRLLHERSHTYEVETRGDLRIVRSLPVRSMRMGLSGITDVVEFHRVGDDVPEARGNSVKAMGVPVDGLEGTWMLYPVEYKRGIIRHVEGSEVQLCAQAMCLEEMLDTTIAEGSIYYGKSKRRYELQFDEKLRDRTKRAASRIHALMKEGITPAAEYSRKCDTCSLMSSCMPKIAGAHKSATRYLEENLREIEGEQ